MLKFIRNKAKFLIIALALAAVVFWGYSMYHQTKTRSKGHTPIVLALAGSSHHYNIFS